MSTTTTERTTTERGAWTCENCQGVTSAVRKRCRDCGTSRY
jgi:predicted RNA-binding protein YlxR (DUF448 family)